MATFALFVRMVLALGVVLFVVYAMARVARRSQRRERRFGQPGGRIDIVGRKNLSRTNALMLVRSEGRQLLVGMTAQSLSLIADLTTDSESDAVESNPSPTTSIDSAPPWTVGPGDFRPPSAWDAVVNTLRERSVRR